MKRRPNTQELAILEKLLSINFSQREDLLRQLEDIEVEPTNDNDNYGSIYLLPTHNIRTAHTKLRVPVEGIWKDVDGQDVNILLHVVNGSLNELEIVKLDGSNLKGKINPDEIILYFNS